jgi:hypothetical protein
VGLGFALGVPTAALSAGLYAYLSLLIPVAGIVAFVLAIGFGVLLGVSTGVGLRLGQVRNGRIATAAAGLVAVFGLYLAWAVSIAARGEPVAGAGTLELLIHPGRLFAGAATVARNGSWSVAGFAPVGLALGAFWLLEATLVSGTAVFLARSAVARPYCESCNGWARAQRRVATLAATERALLVERLETGRLDLLEQLGSPAPDASSWLSLDLESCPGCDALHALSVHQVTVSVDERGARSEVAVPVLTGLLVTSHAARRIRALDVEPRVAPAAA